MRELPLWQQLVILLLLVLNLLVITLSLSIFMGRLPD